MKSGIGKTRLFIDILVQNGPLACSYACSYIENYIVHIIISLKFQVSPGRLCRHNF